nr:MAG TPA: hypothetical protein [Caudoviricetes sp.]
MEYDLMMSILHCSIVIRKYSRILQVWGLITGN